MLKHWYVENFKSFKKPPPIEFSMLNVLAGANSSGKSTLIQSILLLKQTLQYGAEDRPITLNGPLLRMGSFQDVRNFDADDNHLRIGFDIEVRPSESPHGRPLWARSSSLPFQMSGAATWEKISLSLTYGIPDDELLPEFQAQEENLNPYLFSTQLRMAGTSDNKPTLQYCNFFLSSESRWPYGIETDSTTEIEIIDNKPEGKIDGGFISYFLPEISVVHYNQTEFDVSTLVDSIFRPNNSLLSRMPADDHLSREVVAIINQWLVDHNSEPLPTRSGPILASEAQAKLSPFIRPKFLGHLLQAAEPSDAVVADLARLKTNIKTAILSERKVEYQYIGGRSKGMDFAIGYLSDFFKFGVRYLGPLRDSPRPVYQPEALESTTDVGYRGEHTAAVFEINKRNTVTYRIPPSPDTEEDYVRLAHDVRRPLEEAAAEWLEYLGVASSVETKDAGVFGNRMRVSVEDGAPLHDLTNVGVGVSQVLPIVVMALLAPRGSLLIFEQPELHLHPKVQARLADFFLALAIDGKQTLLETHSEYLVDRLRLRIAMSPNDNVRPLVNILFSEKQGGCTRLTPVEISEFGSILNWPTDFFEQSQRDVGKIIQAASRKRKSKPRQG